MATLSNRAGNHDHRSAEGISTPGQSRQFGSATLRRTIEIPRRSKPNRTRIPPEYVRERNGSCSQVWRHVGPPPGLVRHFRGWGVEGAMIMAGLRAFRSRVTLADYSCSPTICPGLRVSLITYHAECLLFTFLPELQSSTRSRNFTESLVLRSGSSVQRP